MAAGARLQCLEPDRFAMGSIPVSHLGMRSFFATWLMITVGILAPSVAWAQKINAAIFIPAVSPIFVIGLAIFVGYCGRSWLIACSHLGLVLVWIALFWISSVYVTNDYIIWTPLALYVAHAVGMIVSSVVKIAKRGRNKVGKL